MTIGSQANEQQCVSSIENLKNYHDASDENSLDVILAQIGEFGRYQMFNYVLLCLPMIFNAFQSISYVFTAGKVVHRCNVDQCDSPASLFSEPWLNYTIPQQDGQYDQCTRYAYNKEVSDNYLSVQSRTDCLEENFNKSMIEKCSDGFKFRDEEYTVANQFELFCSDAWKLNIAGTVNNFGQFIGIPLGGVLADRFGRRNMLAVAGCLSCIMVVIRSFSINYSMFLTFEFLDAVVGSTLFPTAFLLTVEMVGPKRRVAATTMLTLFYSLSEVLLGLLASQISNWRVLTRVLCIPAALHIVFPFLLPESVRWLLSQGKEVQAIAILKRAARINRKELPDTTLKNMINNNKNLLTTTSKSTNQIWLAIKTFFWRLLNCSFCWFTHTLVALGLSLSSVNLGGNKYNNFMLGSLVQIPGQILPLIIMDKVGRRFSLCGSLLVCALCMIATVLFGKNGRTIELILFLIGKFAITCSFQTLYFFTSEIFPTNVRNSLLSLCSMLGRFGSMFAPQVSLLANYYEYGPQILFAGFALVSGCLAILFPETANKTLPATIADACNLKNGFEKKVERDRF